MSLELAFPVRERGWPLEMKKQINCPTKGHLIRGAFYLLLLVTVCAIPFALAQRNAAKQSATKPATTFSSGTATLTNGLTVTYTRVGAPSPTPTPTASPTCTPGAPGPWSLVHFYPMPIEKTAVSSDGTYAYSAGGSGTRTHCRRTPFTI